MTRKQITFLIAGLIITILLTGCTQLTGSNPQDLTTLEEWDLLWISDSSGWGVAEVYAAYIEEDTGIPVNVYDYWDGGLSAGEVLRILEGEHTFNAELAKLPEIIPEMEVIVFYTNPAESVAEANPFDFNCGQDGSKLYVKACDMANFDLYVQHLEAIYREIFKLRGNRPTILRAYDAYNPTLARWDEPAIFESCLVCWGNYNAAIHQAASTFNIPMAQVYDAWNGPDHDQDPNDKGYTKDGEHPNELGAQVIAAELRKLGYEPVSP